MTLATRSNRSLVDPFEMTNDLDSFVQRVFGRGGYGPSLSPYGVDIYEDADHLHVEAELPGFTRDQVDVTIDNNVLTITADRTVTSGEGNGNTNGGDGANSTWLLKERRYTRFQRSFSLPNTIDGSSVDAKLTDGVLHVTLNKRQEAKPRKIAIN